MSFVENRAQLSTEIHEILSKMPKWPIRFGMWIVLSISIFAVFILWTIKYPNCIEGKIVIYQSSLEQMSTNELNDIRIKNELASFEDSLMEISTIRTERIEEIVEMSQTRREYYGKLFLKEREFSRVKVGQMVRIKLKTYSTKKYGMLLGRINRKSKFFKNGKFEVIVKLSNSPVSNRNIEINNYENMSGKGEVILSNKRILNIIFNL